MKRLYYLTQDLQLTRKISDDIHQAGITDWHFRVVCKDPSGLYQQQIHSASPFIRLDIIHTAERGGMIGTLFGGVLAGSLLLLNPPGFPMDLKMFSLIIAICCLGGFWMGASAGTSRENYKIAPFHDQIEAGQYLIIIDVSKSQESAVRNAISHYPEAKLEAEGTSTSNPFRNQEPTQQT
ncbi:MAG: hypothetical protein OQK12_06945 [Motiliproteus sp.]|nr:hypothetical protein [Motiliproteus sp.]MCW9051725.1 hypothetical protein [Motiliproteus sp.]